MTVDDLVVQVNGTAHIDKSGLFYAHNFADCAAEFAALQDQRCAIRARIFYRPFSGVHKGTAANQNISAVTVEGTTDGEGYFVIRNHVAVFNIHRTAVNADTAARPHHASAVENQLSAVGSDGIAEVIGRKRAAVNHRIARVIHAVALGNTARKVITRIEGTSLSNRQTAAEIADTRAVNRVRYDAHAFKGQIAALHHDNAARSDRSVLDFQLAVNDEGQRFVLGIERIAAEVERNRYPFGNHDRGLMAEKVNHIRHVVGKNHITACGDTSTKTDTVLKLIAHRLRTRGFDRLGLEASV